MLRYTIQYRAGAKRVESETFEQFAPIVFRCVIEHDTDLNTNRTYQTDVEFIGEPCWSEQKAISLALAKLNQLKKG